MLLPMPLPQTTEWLCPRRSPSVGYREIQCNITLFIVPPWKGKPIINFLETKNLLFITLKIALSIRFVAKIIMFYRPQCLKIKLKVSFSILCGRRYLNFTSGYLQLQFWQFWRQMHIFEKLYQSYFCA